MSVPNVMKGETYSNEAQFSINNTENHIHINLYWNWGKAYIGFNCDQS